MSKDGKTVTAANQYDGTAIISNGSSSKTIYWVIIANRTYVDRAEFIAALLITSIKKLSFSIGGGFFILENCIRGAGIF